MAAADAETHALSEGGRKREGATGNRDNGLGTSELQKNHGTPSPVARRRIRKQPVESLKTARSAEKSTIRMG